MNYLETLKNITKNKEKRVENIVLLIILLVIILIASKYIFSGTSSNEKSSNSTSSESNINNSESVNKSTENILKSDLETKLSNILSQIAGISDVSIVVTYSQDTKQNPVYNIKEEEKSGEKTTEKSVAYNENGSTKTAIIESVEMPEVEGAIIVAKGASTVEMRSKIATAVSTLTNLPVYKVQVFEKQS